MSKNAVVADAKPQTETVAEPVVDQAEPAVEPAEDAKVIELGKVAAQSRKHYFNVIAPAGRYTLRSLIVSAHESILDEANADGQTVRDVLANFEADLAANLKEMFPTVVQTTIGADLSLRLMLDSEESAKTVKVTGTASAKPKVLAWNPEDVDASKKVVAAFIKAQAAKAREIAGEGNPVNSAHQLEATRAIMGDWGVTDEASLKAILTTYAMSLAGL